MSLFVSYSRRDAATALSLARLLREEGLAIWIDQADIAPGTRWDSEIERALRDCTGLLALLTPASVASQNVLDEIGLALDLKKSVLPVLLLDCEVPLRIRRIQRVPYSDDLRQLAQAIVKVAPSRDAKPAPLPKSPANSTPYPSAPAAVGSPTSATIRHTARRGAQAKKPKVPLPLHQRSLSALIRLRNGKYLELRAIDVALSEIPVDMSGEIKRLGIQRDLIAARYNEVESELAKRASK